MEVSRNVIRISLVFFGILVLISYGIGFSRTDDPMSLWGGLRENAWKFIVPFMLVAIIGFLIYWWTILISVDILVVRALRWPWSKSDGKGANRLFLSLLTFLIPSIFWLEATIFHMNNNYSWTPVLPIGILILVAIGNIMMGLLAFSAYQDDLQGSKLMLLGSVLLGIQCVINDGIIWNAMFPW